MCSVAEQCVAYNYYDGGGSQDLRQTQGDLGRDTKLDLKFQLQIENIIKVYDNFMK